MSKLEEYEIENDEIASTMREIATRVGQPLPTGWGFLLMLFEYGTDDNPGHSFYASSAERESVIAMLTEWLAKHGAQTSHGGMPTQWRKVVAHILLKYAPSSTITITQADFDELGASNLSVAVGTDEHGALQVSVMDTDDLRKLAAAGHAKEA